MYSTETVAIVTGAGTGIGRATAQALLDGGASVALLGRRREPLEEVAAAAGNRAAVFPVDVSDPQAVADAVRAAVDALGAPTLLVNCAGIAMPAPLDEIDHRVWDEMIGINLSGSFYVAREVAMRMADGGSIVNLGSELSLFGMPLYVHYCASKAGVVGLTKALALELAPRGIRVNAVCPGPVDTPMLDAELEWFGDVEEALAGSHARVPLKRHATPEEVAEMILFIGLSARYATGSCYSIDGGTAAG